MLPSHLDAQATLDAHGYSRFRGVDHPQGILDDWDVSHGRKFEADVALKVRTQVYFPKSMLEGSFYMLAVFRLYTFRLDEDTVSYALHSVLGGSPSSFHVRFAFEWLFRFSAGSKADGLMVYDLRRVIARH